MAKDPAFLFYPNDWIGGTMGMSFIEKGAYMELLMMQFNRGHMTDDMIGHAVGQQWDKVKHKFRLDENGLWYNERLDIEKEKRKNFVKSRNNNKLGSNQYNKDGKGVDNNDGHMTTHISSHMEDVNEDVSKVHNSNSLKGGEKTKKNSAEWDEMMKKIRDANPDVPHLNNNSR